jgi:hypothetical protein
MNDVAPPIPPRIPFASQSEHEGALAAIFGAARLELRIFDQHCADLGLNSPERFDTLRQFFLASRVHRLYIAVHDTSYLAAQCPRMGLLLRQFSHAIVVQKTRKELRGLYDNFIVADDAAYLRQFHFEHPRGVFGAADPIEIQALRMRFEEIWTNSTPGLSATTIGL